MSAHVTGGGRRALGLVSAAGGGAGGPGCRDGSGRDPGGAAGSREAEALRPTPELWEGGGGPLGPAELRRAGRQAGTPAAARGHCRAGPGGVYRG